MNTQLVTQHVRIAQWNEIIREKNELGLSVDEFCERNNVSKNMYFYWLRKCKAAAITNAGEAFVELLSPFKSGYMCRRQSYRFSKSCLRQL